MPRDLPPEQRSWLLQRRSALTGRQMQWLFLALCLPTLLIALTFSWRGYWPILAFGILELTVAGALLLHCRRHESDYDRVEITLNGIVIEQRRARRLLCLRLNTWSVRLIPPRRDGDPIRLCDRDHTIAIGALADAARRRHVAEEIARFLPTQ